MGTPEGKRPLEKPGRRWEIGIRMVLRENGGGGVEWLNGFTLLRMGTGGGLC
jgi:hypothetical protein